MLALPLLYCFPYAGGDIHVFREWRTKLAAEFDVRPVQLPGRGRMLERPQFGGMADAIEYLLDHCPKPDDRGVVLFGHSMGALLAYELSRAWLQRGGMGPDLLVLSALSPQDHCAVREPLHRLDDRELAVAIADLGGTPQAVLDDPELMDLVLPLLRADLRLCERHSPTMRAAINVPILAFAGVEDRRHPPSAMAEWARHSTSSFTQINLPGGHFFINTHSSLLIQSMQDSIARGNWIRRADVEGSNRFGWVDARSAE